jgi:prepilin-type N-terminal cleavage/methylation domain-containing protein
MTMRTRKNGERGMSLIEVLVATAILVVATLIALSVYDASRNSFKKGENATVQQEAVRIAYDRLGADLRMLGFNTNPDGLTARPDEQLEVALDHAIIFRGDFDAEDATRKNDHEGALAGGAFGVVSTGNDEVVGYVLSKPDGTGPDTITFKADVDDQPRNGTVTDVTVNNVVLNPTSPPYTLYKISLNNNVATCCNGDFIVRTPVVENVRSLTLQYFDASSVTPIAAPGAAETAAAKTSRADVTRFNVSLIGMTRDPDMNYTDTSDPAARKYRKFELRGDVVPRNMRMKGIQDLSSDSTPPGKPATPVLLAGHCGALIVTWAANPSGDGVAQYRVNYGPAAGKVSGTRSAVGSPMYLDGFATPSTIYVSIQAQDGAGNLSVKSNEANAVVANTNTPSAPTAPSATTDQVNNVRLSWTAVTTNTASVPAGDPLAPACRDLAGYRVYRNDNAVTGPLLVNEGVVHAPNSPPYNDTATINCHDYYYKVAAVDTCGIESALTDAFRGQATSSIAPKAPTNVQAFLLGKGDANVTWSAVVKDVSEHPIVIGAYDVYRSEVMAKTDPVSSAVFPDTPIGTSSTLSYADKVMPPLKADETLYYMVKAKDECVNYSEASDPAEPGCAFSGTVVINPPTEGGVVAGPVTTTVTVVAGTDTYTGVTITYTHAVKGVTRTFTSSSAGPAWTDSEWLAMPTGPYTITATVTNSTGCSSTTTMNVSAGSVVGCCLHLVPSTTTVASCSSGAAKCKEVSYDIANDGCLTSVSLTSLTVGWTDFSGNNPRWQTAQFNGSPIAASGVPSWTTTYTGSPETGTATKSNFSAPSPQVPYANPTTPGTTTKVTYVLDQFTDAKIKGKRVVDVFDTNQFVFTLLDSFGNPSDLETTCEIKPLKVN